MRNRINLNIAPLCDDIQEKAFKNGKTCSLMDEFVKVLKTTVVSNHKKIKIIKLILIIMIIMQQDFLFRLGLVNVYFKTMQESMILNAMLRYDYYKRADIVCKVGDRRKETSRVTGVCRDKYNMASKEFSKLKGKAYLKIIIFLVLMKAYLVSWQAKLPIFLFYFKLSFQ